MNVRVSMCTAAVCRQPRAVDERTDGTFVCCFYSLSCISHQIYGDEPSLDGCPVAEGELESMVTGNTFIGLRKYYEQVIRAVLNDVLYIASQNLHPYDIHRNAMLVSTPLGNDAVMAHGSVGVAPAAVGHEPNINLQFLAAPSENPRAQQEYYTALPAPGGRKVHTRWTIRTYINAMHTSPLASIQ